MRRVKFMLRMMSGVMLLATASDAFADDDAALRYNRDVRPILADRCFRCHGPDAGARQAEIRLDRREDAISDRDGRPTIASGHPERSEMMRRVTSVDPDERMPPPETGSPLTERETEILRQWISAGAEYEQHWSFIVPIRPASPIVNNDQWAVNSIDRFVLARLQREGLNASAEAMPATLIRRLTLDITGLPPTLSEVDAFESEFAANADAAYERLVDRLLTSPRYGERMANDWLDAARFADTNGYFTDNDRIMWPWRDWVINAFNDNMPFDRFTIEQLAGDLLPNATPDQNIATGFNRNHMVNNETGIIEEEFRVEYVADRVDTTATVWMGLTIGCARCHDHKFDPISQKDFYRFFSVFNNVPERGLSGSSGNSAPFLKVISTALQQQIDGIRTEVVAAEELFASFRDELEAAQAQWEATALQSVPKASSQGLTTHLSFDAAEPTAVRVGSVTTAAGVSGNAVRFYRDAEISIADVADFDADDAFSFGAWIRPAGDGCVLSKMDDANSMRGYDLVLRKGRAGVNLVHRWNQSAIRVTTTSVIPSSQWQHLFVTYDGSGKASGVCIYRNGQPQPVQSDEDSLTGSLRNNDPVRLGRRQSSASYSGLIDNVRIYNRSLPHVDVQELVSDELVRGILACPVAERSDEQKHNLKDWFIQHVASQKIASASHALKTLQERERQTLADVPTTMVMQESDERRAAFLLVRGEYDQHGEEVAPGIPGFLSTGAATTVDNRLQLAAWLVSPANPLTARVTVNRLWQQLFGTGLVESVDDFGIQGEWPSHPELLDWLAVELIENGWDIKQLLRTIVTSRTYRQSSNCSAELLQADRNNRLLARGPRFRLSAEQIRDNALAISGLLVHRIGGESVKPYQPAGLWEEVTYDGDAVYEQGNGDALHRRSLYTFWKRQSPPPNMVVFDAPTRETCVVRRSRTNTPLQALVLMNDPTFVEAARKLAERTMLAENNGDRDRIVFAFRSAVARRPTNDDVRILLSIFESQRTTFENDPNAATLLLQVGESDVEQSLNPAELSAWTTVASVILSLDETISKP